MRPPLPLVLCLLAVAPPSLARRPPASPSDADKKARAQKLVADGRGLFDRGSFAPALGRFEEAWRLFPVPKMLYNLGITYDALHRDDRALCALERFVTEVPDADAERKDDAVARITRLKTNIGRLEVSAPAGTVLMLDGEERDTVPPKVPLCATRGWHHFEAVAPSSLPAGLQVDVDAGGLVKLSLDPTTNTLRVLPDPAREAAVAATAPRPSRESSAEKPLYKKWWLWTIVGVVTAGAVTAVVVGTQPNNVQPPQTNFGPIAVFR